MGLKVATTAFFIFGVILLAAWPWVIGAQPGDEAGRQAQAAYAVRFGLFIIVLMLDFAVTAILALLVLRKQRLAFRDKAKANLQDLIEGTLKDHGKKAGR